MRVDKCEECNENKQILRGHCIECYMSLLNSNQCLKFLPNQNKIIPPKTLTIIQKEVLTGLMLGDGNLFDHSNRLKPTLSVSRSVSDLEYLYENYETFSEFCSCEPRISKTFDSRTEKTYYSCKFSTVGSLGFFEFYKAWYPINKKEVPKDLLLTPLSCAIWFCDDGCVMEKNGLLSLKLSTHGFSKEENEFLILKLKETLKIHFTLRKDKECFYIGTSTKGSQAFIKYIENHISKTMLRKITWSKETLEKSSSLPHINGRTDSDLNVRELKILLALKDKKLSYTNLAYAIDWIDNLGRIGSGLSNYLLKLTNNQIISKNNKQYEITVKGTNILNEILSKY